MVESGFNTWLWSVSEKNWEILKKRNVWASSNNRKIRTVVRPYDKVVFYVTGIKQFKGIYTFVSDWYDAKEPIWFDEGNSVKYPSQIKIEPLRIGSLSIYDAVKKLHVFLNVISGKGGKLSWNQSMILKPRSGGYPSNNGKPIPVEDYDTLLENIQGVIESKKQDVLYSHAKKQFKQHDFSSPDVKATVSGRVNQGLFKDLLLDEYNRECAMCGLSIEKYLIGSHIIPFKIMQKYDPKNAMNPSDGLLLCKLCDIAFELGHIIVEKNLEIKKTEKLIVYSEKDPAVQSWLSHIGHKIPLPKNSEFQPAERYLQKKLELVKEKSKK